MPLRMQSRVGHLLRHRLQATAWRQSWRTTASGNVDIDGDRITIGDIAVPLTKPKKPHLVPHKYGKLSVSMDGAKFTQSVDQG